MAYVATANSGADTQTTSRSNTKPAGVAAGDIAIFYVGRWSPGGFAAVTATPPGAVLLATVAVSELQLLVYAKYVQAGDSTYTFQWGTTDTWSSLVSQYYTGRVQGLDLTTLVHSQITANSATIASRSVTAAAGDDLAWGVDTHMYAGGETHTPPTGFTEDYDAEYGTTAHRDNVTAGTQTASGGTISGAQNHAVILIALPSAGAAPAITGSGSATAPAAVVSGSGNIGEVEITGNGTVAAPAAVVAGAGTSPPLPFSYITSIAGTGNQQYPADQNGDPILVKGDVVWAFPGNAGRWGGTYQSVMSAYLDVRQSQGFNLLMIGCLGSTENGTVSDDGATYDGVLPWATTPGTLNDAYWQRIDYLVDQAAARGITVLLNFAYGYDVANGALSTATNAQFTTYGTNLGNRYKDKPNIIWGAGGDYFDVYLTQYGNVFSALDAAGDTHIHSVQNYPETTSRFDIFDNSALTTGATYSDWNFVYSYNVTYDGIEYAYDEASPIMAIWGDGHFDQNTTADRKVMRDDLWWAFSSGARGHIYGSEGVWNWQAGADTNISTETLPSQDLAGIWATFESFTGWHQLVPDTDSSFVTAGRGTHKAAIASGGGGNEYDSTDPQDQYVTASVAPDGSLAVVYFPVDQTITVDPAELTGTYTVRWVDPADGTSTPQTIQSTYSPTGPNSLGGPDWLLVFEAFDGVTGTGSLTAPTGSVAGAGTVTVAGSGDCVAATAATIGAGAVSVTASGSTSAPLPELAGVGEVVPVGFGSGAVTAAPGQAAGSGSVLVAGSGSCVTPEAQAHGTATVLVTGSGASTAPGAEASGTGSTGAVPVTGAGTAQATSPVVAGAGAVAVAGFGGLSAAPASAAGTGGPVITGTGAAVASAASVDGFGNIGEAPVTGSGSLTAPPATVTGEGDVPATGNGAALAPPAAASGSGDLGAPPITGNGTVAAPAPTSTGAGTVHVDGNGSIVTPTAIIDGSGAVTITGAGEATAPEAVLSGTVFAAITFRPNEGSTARLDQGRTPRL